MKVKRKILVMGLPGSGKTTLAEKLVSKLGAAWFNADAVRQDIYSELGFSEEDRIAHATRMGKLCDWAKMGGSYVIADFVCPTKETKDNFDPDITIWMNTIESGRYEDTNKMFEKPKEVNFVITEMNDNNHKIISEKILNHV